MKEDAIIGVSLVVILVLAAIGAMSIAKNKCELLAQRSQVRTEFHLTGGCYVEVNGKMVPESNWRVAEP